MAAQDVILLQTLINKTVEGLVTWKKYSIYDSLPQGSIPGKPNLFGSTLNFIRGSHSSGVAALSHTVYPQDGGVGAMDLLIYKRNATEELFEELIEAAQESANGAGIPKLLADLKALGT